MNDVSARPTSRTHERFTRSVRNVVAMATNRRTDPMRMRTRPSLRHVVTALAVAATAATATTVVDTPPSHAATAAACNGYVGLTFDDGPSSSTPALLNALKQNGLRATMFNQGQYAASNPAQVRAQVDAGMWVANHSYTHPHLTQQTQAQVESEISRTQQAIAAGGGGTPKLFRPPYGESNATVRAAAAKYGLTQIIWDVDSQDWNNASTDAIVQANARLTDGQIILMHDWPANTLAAIPRIAQGLASRGLCAGMIPADRPRRGSRRGRQRWRGQRLHRHGDRRPEVERPLQPQRHGRGLRQLDRHHAHPHPRQGPLHLEHHRHLSRRADAHRPAQRQRQHLGHHHPGQRQLDLAHRHLHHHLTTRQTHGRWGRWHCPPPPTGSRSPLPHRPGAPAAQQATPRHGT